MTEIDKNKLSQLIEDFEKLDDANLAEIIKTRMHDGQKPIAILLEDL